MIVSVSASVRGIASLLRRLLRLSGQSRIRLPSAPVRAEEIGVGDGLQIGGRLFRVVGSRRMPGGGVALELARARGPERVAVLLAAGDAASGGFRLLRGGAQDERVPPELLVHFPVM